MTRDQAKFILTAFRANAADRDEAMFAEALARLREDPELAAWFAREQSHDLEVANRLREVPAPDGLREAILAGVKVSGRPAAPARRLAAWGLAAAAAIAAVTAVSIGRHVESSSAPIAPSIAPPVAIVPPARTQLQGLESFAINDTLMAGGPHMGEWGPVARELHRALSQPAAKLGPNLPIDYEALCNTGARKLMFEDREVVEVCFHRDDIDLWYHLYILKRADFPVLAPPEPIMHKGEQEGVAFAYWHDDNFHYLVTGPGDPQMVKRLF